MPDIAGFEYLADCFDELGCAKVGAAGGLTGIEFPDVESWQNVAKTDLSPWALVLLVKMSRAYAGQANASADPKAAPPYELQYTEEDMTVHRDNVDAKLRGMFSG